MINIYQLQTLKDDVGSLFDLKHSISGSDCIQGSEKALKTFKAFNASIENFFEYVDEIFTLLPEETNDRRTRQNSKLESEILNAGNQAHRALITARNSLNSVDRTKDKSIWNEAIRIYVDTRDYYYKKVRPLTLSLSAFDSIYLPSIADKRSKSWRYYDDDQKKYYTQYKRTLLYSLRNFLSFKPASEGNVDDFSFRAKIKLSREIKQVEESLIDEAKRLTPPVEGLELPENFQRFSAEFNQAFDTRYHPDQLRDILYDRKKAKAGKGYEDLVDSYIKNMDNQCYILDTTKRHSKASKISDKLKPLLLLHLIRLNILASEDLAEALAIHSVKRIDELKLREVTDTYNAVITAIRNPEIKSHFTENLNGFTLKNHLAIPSNLLLLWNLNPSRGIREDDLVEGFNQSLAALNDDLYDDHNHAQETLQKYGEAIIDQIYENTTRRERKHLVEKAPKYMRLIAAYVYQNLNKTAA